MSFLVGHKFIPSPIEKLDIIAPRIIDDIAETFRKNAWKELLGTEKNESWTGITVRRFSHPVIKNKRIVESNERYLKNTTIGIVRNACDDILKSRKPMYWTRRELWLSLLNVKGFRWSACDKNLGLMLLDEKEYIFLQNRESLNYRKTNDCEFTILARKMLHIRDIEKCFKESNSFKSSPVLKEIIDVGINSITCPKNSRLDEKTFSLPTLKLLIKKHKAMKNGHYQTRPIIPNTGLPEYGLSKAIGAILAEITKDIPWIIHDVSSFKNWLVSFRTPHLRCFDFSNLYGNEPVRDTLKALRTAWHTFALFTSMKDRMSERTSILHKELAIKIRIPEHLCGILKDDDFNDDYDLAVVILVAHAVYETYVKIETKPNTFEIFVTNDFLAMGSSPVAPLSNLTLAFFEESSWGWWTCVNEMRRLIDDIAVNTLNCSPVQLMATYPNYLTLNFSSSTVFLDIEVVWNYDHYEYFPYIKPFGIIPLNWFSNHPTHLKIAIAKNELRRLFDNCSSKSFRKGWRAFWRTKFESACYPKEILDDVIRGVEKEKDIKRIRKKDTSLIHITGFHESINFQRMKKGFTNYGELKVMIANTMNRSLQEEALNAGKRANECNSDNLHCFISSFILSYRNQEVKK